MIGGLLRWLWNWGTTPAPEWPYAESLCIHDLVLSTETVSGLSLSTETISGLAISADTVTGLAMEDC